MSNYRLYQEALTSAGRGTPLWEHSAENDCKPIRIGDIGYLRFGLFLRVFNATLPSGHVDNEFGEPSGYTPLVINPDLIQRTTIPKGIVASSGVEPYNNYSNSKTSIVVKCIEKAGAIVVSESDVESEDVVHSSIFTDYISQHAHSWVDFIDDIGRDVALHELIFVTGADSTSGRCSVTVFNDARLPKLFGRSNTFEIDLNARPLYSCDLTSIGYFDYGVRRPATTPKSRNCLFVRGFKLLDRHIEQKETSGKSQGNICELGGGYYPGPLDAILRYLVDNSDADMAIAHDMDLRNSLRDIGITNMYTNFFAGVDIDFYPVLRLDSNQSPILYRGNMGSGSSLPEDRAKNVMTTIARRPLGTRQPEHTKLEKLLPSFPLTNSPRFVTPAAKRPRSPDLDDVNYSKRCKNAPQPTAWKPKLTPLFNACATKDPGDKQRQKEQRQVANQEFVAKYTKAFPTFVFFFDERDGGRQQMESRILALGARIEHFFSAHVTHVITNCPQPPKTEQHDPNKENYPHKAPTIKGTNLKSPIQLKTCNDSISYDKLVRDAVRLNRKIWSLSKIESVLSRLTNNFAKSRVEGQSAPLTQLLEKERLNGTTERDPKEKRHDYQYFSKGSHFFLVEDIRGEVAPIAIVEYAPLSKFDRTPTYPVLYMDPRARSPFTKYDEKEARKQEKLDGNEKLKDAEKARRYTKVKELLKNCDREFRAADRLRRRASMSNVGQHVKPHNEVNTAVDSLGSGQANSTATYRKDDDQVASGIYPSTMGLGNGYLAASGNSVIITSTTTTSIARNVNPVRLPTNLREQLGRQVVMNRRLENPNKAQPCLKKSKSTTTMRLPAREETKKPGYCEACRTKFDDFTTHLKSSRHRRFARNESNYTELDVLLERLERRTMTEVEILTSMVNESSITFPEQEHRTAEPSDGCLGPGDYFYTPLTKNSAIESTGGKEGVSDCQEEAEVEVEVDDEEGYIILDDD